MGSKREFYIVDRQILPTSIQKVIEVNAKAGNDVIVDQTLNNTNYIFNLGDGRDSIYDKDSSVDQISFGAGITLEQLQFTQSGRDLVI